MAVFQPGRLKNARLLAGFSLRELEMKLSYRVSYNAINKYERGMMQPDAGTLISLAEILKVRPGYFFEKSAIDLGVFEFKQQGALGKSEVEQLRAKTITYLQRYLETESLLGISQKFVNPLSRKQVKEVAKSEEMAETLRAEWGLGLDPIPNVVEMLEDHQVRILEAEGPEKFDSISTIVNRVPVIVINESFTAEKKRYTALYELGQLMLNVKIDSRKDRETSYHRFAGAILFPKAAVFKTFGNRRNNIAFGELAAINEKYGISILSAIKRLFDLEIITPSTYKFLCMKLAGNSKDKTGTYRGEEKSSRQLKMAYRLVSEGIISIEKAAELTGLSTPGFKALFTNVSVEDDEENYLYNSPVSSFGNAWDDDEPEYTIDDVKIVNPDYEPG